MTKGLQDRAPYLLGSWQVYPNLNRLVNGSEVRKLRPQVMDLLTFLVQKRGELVTSDEMLESIWSGKVVSSATVYSTVAQLRRKLTGIPEVSLETIPRRGYRLVGPAPQRLPKPNQQTVGAGYPMTSGHRESQVSRKTGRFNPLARASLIAGIALAVVLSWISYRPATHMPDGAEGSSPASGSPAGDAVPTVAVLPFRNLAADEENSLIAFGVQEEILTQLSRLPDIDVISRTSVMRYSGDAPSLPEVAKALNATHIVEGSIQRAGDRLRVTAQLIDASTDTHVWADTYDRELLDVFAIQTDVAIQVANALESTFSPNSLSRPSGLDTRSLAAYEWFLKARQLGGNYIAEGVREQQVEYLHQAAAADPDYADAWQMLVRPEAWMVHIGADPEGHHLRAAEYALRQAQRLEPESTDTMLAEGWFLYHAKKQYEAALSRVKAARTLEPRRGDLIELEGFVVNRLGRTDKSLTLLDQASRLDPLNTRRATAIGWRFVHNGRYEQGLKAFLRAISANQNPGPWAKYNVDMARVLVSPDYREWRLIHEDLLRAHKDNPRGLPNSGSKYQFIEYLFLTGQRETAWNFLDRPGGEVDSDNDRGVHSGYWEATALSFRGEEWAARELAERVLEETIAMARRPDLEQLYRNLSALHRARLGLMLGRRDIAREALAYIREKATGYYIEATVVSEPEEAQRLYLEGEDSVALHHFATRPHIWYPLLDHPEVRAKFDNKPEWVQFMRDSWPDSRKFPFD